MISRFVTYTKVLTRPFTRSFSTLTESYIKGKPFENPINISAGEVLLQMA